MLNKNKAVIGSVILVSLVGCANKDPVKSFAESAKVLTSSFDSYASNLRSTCQRKYIYMSMDSDGWYDAQKDNSAKDADCTSFEKSVKTLNTLSDAVGSYAASLGKLAGIKSDTFGSDLDTVSKQVSLLNKGGGEKVSDKSIVAATNLLKSAAEVAVDYFVEREIKQRLRENNESLKDVLSEMKTFSNRIYRKQLEDVKEQNDVLVKQLYNLSYVPAYAHDSYAPLLEKSLIKENPDLAHGTTKENALSAGARLPYRLAQIQLVNEQKAIDVELSTLAKFSEACDAMSAAHESLKDNFGKLSREEMLKQVKDFYEKSKDVRENIKNLKS